MANEKYPDNWDDLTNHQKRAFRMAAARAKGTHTKAEWEEMKAFFNNTCCRCFGQNGLLRVEKDHIIPIYQGGSDSIKNIQPLCAKCNCSKGPDNVDLRPQLAARLCKVLPLKWIGE